MMTRWDRGGRERVDEEVVGRQKAKKHKEWVMAPDKHVNCSQFSPA